MAIMRDRMIDDAPGNVQVGDAIIMEVENPAEITKTRCCQADENDRCWKDDFRGVQYRSSIQGGSQEEKGAA
jgi:hypothetical protein